MLVADWIVFVILLLVSLGIGFYFGRNKNMTKDDFLMASKDMNPITVGLSIFVSYVSALSIVSMPGEIYRYGNAYLWNLLLIPIVVIISCYTFLPVFYRTKSESVYTYLELRFSQTVSYICLLFAQVSWMVYIAMCVWSPALVVITMLKLDSIYLYPNMAILCILCMAYTLMGGMKAVIWTDVIQGIVMVITILFIAGKLAIDLGFNYVLEKCEESQCNTVLPTWLNASDHFDIRYRTPPVFFVFRQFIDTIMMLPLQQSMVQRFQMCGSMSKGREAFAVGTLFIVITEAITVFVGMAAIAFYFGLDPIQLGVINRPEQITPLMLTDHFTLLPGFMGVFLIATYSATLSSFSTFLSSTATVLLPLVKKTRYAHVEDVKMSKILIVIIGIATFCLAVAMSFMKGTMIGILFALTGNIGAPFFGCCLGGMLIPFLNTKGAMAGLVAPILPIAIKLTGIVFDVLGKGFVQDPLSRMQTALTVNETLLLNRSDLIENWNMSSSWNIEDYYDRLEAPHEIIEESPLWLQFIFCQSPFVFGSMGLAIFFLIAIPVSWFTRDPDEKVSKKLFAFYTEDDVEAEDITSEEIKAEESHLMS